jgi:hypothetical protein
MTRLWGFLSAGVFALGAGYALAAPPTEQAPPSPPAVTIGPPAPAGATSLSEEKQGRVGSRQEPAVISKFLNRKDLTYIPLPAFAYNRNESFYLGALMPILKTNERQEIDDIFAPQYLYNRYVGSSVTGNYYGYRSDTVQYHAIASYAEKVQKNFDFAYKDLGAGGGRYILGGQVNWFKNPFARFFGLGNNSKLSNETNYTSRETNVNVTIGINLSPDFSILLTERYRDVRLENGIISSLPNTTSFFRNGPGVEGAQIIGTKLSLLYDTRDSQLTPLRGSYINASVELNTNVQHDEPNRWLRMILDARHLFPHDQDRKVFVARFLIDGVMRTDNSPLRSIPFYERPTLGGENTLRAFGLSRFISDGAILLNLEERVLVAEREFFGHKVDGQLAPFVDIGRVERFDRRGFTLNHIQVNPGVGIRVMAKPHVVGRVDVAYGKDGGNAFVGLDYPF